MRRTAPWGREYVHRMTRSSPSARRGLLGKALSLVSLVALTLSFNGLPFAPTASAASLVTDFRQASNNTGAGLGVVTWINSIIQSSNSVYHEGMGVPQRVLFTNVPAASGGIHSLTFSHQFTKGGVHAYDFLVSWAAAQKAAELANTAYDPDLFSQTCGENIGPPGTLQATCTALLGQNHISIPVPNDTFTSWAGGSVNTKEAAFDTRIGMSDATARSIDVYANAPISAGSVALTHNVSSGGDSGDSDVDYVLQWTSTATQYLIQFAGHLAVSGNAGTNPEAWTPTTGSSQISGGPYHFHIYTLDGASLGAQDNQIKGADILNVPNTPSVSTTMSATSPIAIGTSVHDSATISGATSTAGGTISYGLYSNNTCTTLVQDLTPTINTVTAGVAPDSNSYQFTSAGTWYFQATYSGDANNTGPVSSACTSETMVVSPNTPSVSTTMSATSPIAIGTSVHDSATISGATSTAGGTISYGLYSNNTCTTLVQDLTPTINTVTAGVAPDSNSYQFTSAGTWYFQATYSGDANNTGPVSSACTSETMVVSPNTPSVSTTMSATSPIAIGTSVHDSATISGATSTAGGTISYGLYSNNTCTTLVQDLTPTINTVTAGVAPDSNSYQFTSAGTWYFQATYSGDANNTGPVSSACTSETMVVSPNTPSVSTTMSATSPIAIGTSVHDSATISGATSTAGGTISYGLYSNNTCTTLVQDLTPTINTVTAGVAPDSNSYQFTSAGTWYFQATYSGDANNTGPVSSACTSETMVVSPNTPSVSTTMSATSPIAIGTSVHDSATISGATSTAGGTISYGLYSNNTCTTLVQDLTPTINTVTAGVAPDSNSYQFTSAGTWYFQATYSGDANNTGPVSSACTSETMVVSPNTPTIDTTPNPSTGAVGAVLNDSATLADGSNPKGTITFNLYGPGDTTCAGPVLFTQDVTVSGNNVYSTSVGYTTTAPGTFHWTASYVSSDANNTNVASGCADEPVVISGGNFGYTPGFWQSKNGHDLINQYTLLPVPLGQQGPGLRYFNVQTIAQSDKILPPPNGCTTSIFNCRVTGLSQDLNQGTFENLAMQTLALAYNIEYFGDVGTVFGTQTLGQLGATPALGLTSSSTVQDVLDLANQFIANSASGGSTTQAQATAMISLISYIDSI